MASFAGLDWGAGRHAVCVVDEQGKAESSVSAGLGATPGNEHLSSLREAYLRLLAGENGLGFLRLAGARDLVQGPKGSLAQNITALDVATAEAEVRLEADVRA